MTDQKKPQRARRREVTTASPSYVNHVDTSHGTCEIQIQLKRTEIAGGDDPSVQVVDVGKVVLPVQTAKALAFQLLCNIASYETLLGPVNLNTALIPAMPSAACLGPDTVARLAILHGELFAHVATPAPATTVSSNSPLVEEKPPAPTTKITTH